mmetsp:Transcript_7149/g.20715  ORF Transcript_7149/g.20715 Transcript_7149/m.20715 type:complete len:210 (-) Transcript_7149:230-859(-)
MKWTAAGSSSRPALTSSLLTSMPSVARRERALGTSEHARALPRSFPLCVCTSWPRPTSRRLTSAHTSRGIHDSMAWRVFSGFAVGSRPVHPSWLQIRCTCVSTLMPSHFPKATLRRMIAILGPTPGSLRTSSMLEGTRPPCWSAIMRVASLMYFTLLLKKPTLRMSSRRSSSEVARTLDTVRPWARSPRMTSALMVSLVCEESMRLTRQ